MNSTSIEALLRDLFNLQAPQTKRLNGYENINYRVKDAGRKYVFKTYPFDQELYDILQAETEALLYLNRDNEKALFPTPVAAMDGSYVLRTTIDGQASMCRMLTFLEGEFMGDVAHTPALFKSFGTFLAEMNLKLQAFESYVSKSRVWEWDLQHLHLNTKYAADIPDPHNRNVFRYFLQQFEEHARPVLPTLRKQTIHNDANEWNVLTQGDAIAGVIDFGDMAYAPLICELSVAIAYACFDKENPLGWAARLLKAYHEVTPLEEQEVSILYYLVAGRLCTSVGNSSHARIHDPENSYATGSEEQAWRLLHQWLAIGPMQAENAFRKAVGLSDIFTQTTEAALTRRHRHISPILSVSYKGPIQMASAAFQYMYDAQGNTFLDAYNNIPHVGHSHPRVVEAGQRQMARLNTNTRYLYDQLPAYAEKLLATFPKALNKVYFVNSGSAASDLAMRMVHAHTGHRRIMVMEHGYHGNTQLSIDISDYKFSNKKGQGQKDYILKTAIPDTFRGAYTQNDGTAGRRYAADAIQQIESSKVPIAAFVSEPIVGCGGQVPLAKSYLETLYPAIRKQGGLCISDEVQTGFGRLGDHFWGFEAQAVVPDIVILGKPMGNGQPMGAVICTDEVAASFGKGVEFFSSFGGNPVSCAIGSAVLDVIEEESLQANAKEVGDYYMGLLHELAQSYPCIGDVRGSGLFIGIEFVKNEQLEPDTYLAQTIKNELRNRHILVSTDGPYDSVIKTKPPLCFSKANAKTVVEAMADILGAK